MNKATNGRNRTFVISAMLIATLPGLVTAASVLEYRSPSRILRSHDGKELLVVETTAKSVTALNVTTGNITRRYSPKQNPSGLALSPDGHTLYVTTGVTRGEVCVFNTASGKQINTYAVGHTPIAPVVSKDGQTLYICNRLNNDISVIDTTSGKTRVRIPVRREPVSAALTTDGAHLLVVNHLPAGAATEGYVGAVLSVVDTRTLKVVKSLKLPNGSNGLNDITLSPDGKYAYIGHVLARYQLPTTQLERGWVNTNAISVFDLLKLEHFNTFLLDDIDLGAPNPWGIAITDDGKTMAVTHSGSHEISLIDRTELHKKLATAEKDQVPNELSFLVGIRHRVKLEGKGPRSCTFVGKHLYTAQFFSDDVGVVDLSDASHPIVSTLSLGPVREMDEVRRGRFLFNDGSFCFQQWMSCTSCHPSERMDALNWDILNDGIGNPKNTKTLLYSHRTPPTTVTGCRPNAETSVRAGIRFFMAVLPESDAVALDTFLKSMRPVPSPFLVNGKLSSTAKHGKKVFRKAKCTKCHSGELFTDMKLHNVGTGRGRDIDTKFDVPALIEIWRSAPYLHDGRAVTIRDVLTTHNPDDEHGYTQDLSKQELDDLVEYILTL